eukprot:9096287-Pyramimonas_sp.AAC.1
MSSWADAARLGVDIHQAADESDIGLVNVHRGAQVDALVADPTPDADRRRLRDEQYQLDDCSLDPTDMAKRMKMHIPDDTHSQLG